ncbi:MAG: zinc ribbon domain-containing protein [Fuerstiella sp.]|nr:zinc ribbon domain-containing protein [Fuerstiella sp.]
MSRFCPADSFNCPHCGKELPAEANRCRRCGASNECGWQESCEEFIEDGYTEDDTFDYEAFVEREFGNSDRPATEQTKNFWIQLVILAVVVSLLLPFAVQLLSFF